MRRGILTPRRALCWQCMLQRRSASAAATDKRGVNLVCARRFAQQRHHQVRRLERQLLQGAQCSVCAAATSGLGGSDGPRAQQSAQIAHVPPQCRLTLAARVARARRLRNQRRAPGFRKREPCGGLPK